MSQFALRCIKICDFCVTKCNETMNFGRVGPLPQTLPASYLVALAGAELQVGFGARHGYAAWVRAKAEEGDPGPTGCAKVCGVHIELSRVSSSPQ